MYKLKLLKYVTLLGAMLLFSGCSKDEESDSASKPIADFSFTNDGSTFTFTNLSTNGTSYKWDFGDLYYYSFEENPVYTYRIGGEILVSLTITNEAGEESYISKTIMAPEIIVVNIEIDGDFDDWDNVEYASESTTGNGSIQKVKIWAGINNINVYLEGNTNMQMELVDIFIDSDGNDQSGFLSWQWPNGSGADYLFEGPLVSNGWGDFFKYNGVAGAWGWNQIAGSGINMKSSGIVNLNATTNAIEFSIPKTQLGTLGSYIGFAFTELTSGWATVASYPEVTSTSEFVKIDL